MEFAIDDVALGDIDACARIACDSEIGARYGFERASLAERMRAGLASGSVIVAARAARGAGAILGFAWIEPRGAFGSAPYLKLIAVDSKLRGSGVGGALLAEFERRGADIGRVWTLMVSDFNARGIAFYEKHGYAAVGAIPGFAREGITEILMAKAKP